MKKRVKSNLIEQFLWHVKNGLICGKDGDQMVYGPDTSGPHMLIAMTEALQRILNGTLPDDALGIERRPGASGRIQRALPLVHELRKRNTPWKQVADICHISDEKNLANEYRKRREHFEALDDMKEVFAKVHKGE